MSDPRVNQSTGGLHRGSSAVPQNPPGSLCSDCYPTAHAAELKRLFQAASCQYHSTAPVRQQQEVQPTMNPVTIHQPKIPSVTPHSQAFSQQIPEQSDATKHPKMSTPQNDPHHKCNALGPPPVTGEGLNLSAEMMSIHRRMSQVQKDFIEQNRQFIEQNRQFIEQNRQLLVDMATASARLMVAICEMSSLVERNTSETVSRATRASVKNEPALDSNSAHENTGYPPLVVRSRPLVVPQSGANSSG